MKKVLYLSMATAVLALAASCNKSDATDPVVSNEPAEVVFRAAGPVFNADVATKATVENQTTLTSFNVAAATGIAGSSGAQVWNGVFSKDGSLFKGGKYWPSTNPTYHFYASNAAVTVSASGATVAATNAKDVVCAYLPASQVGYKTTNSLAFEHVFARIGDVTVSAASGYTLSGVSITLVPKTGGTYNLFSGAGTTDGTGWSATTNGTATGIANATAGTKSNDIYLVPGQYELTATWTATSGDYTQTFSNKKKTVSIVGGKVNKISTTLGGEASEIEFTITVAEWGENTIPVTFDM